MQPLKSAGPLFKSGSGDHFLSTHCPLLTALIEVKSGRNRKAKSLSTLMSEKDRTHRGYRIMDSNIETDDRGIIRLPLYAPCFFEEARVSNIPEPPSAEEANEAFRRRSQGA